MIGNWRRAFFWAILWGAVGFFVPWGVNLIQPAARLAFSDTHPVDRINDIAQLKDFRGLPAATFAIIFALAAFAAYFPIRGLDMVRSLIIVAGLPLLVCYLFVPWTWLDNYHVGNQLRRLFVVIPTAIVGFGIVLYLGKSPIQRSESDEAQTL